MATEYGDVAVARKQHPPVRPGPGRRVDVGAPTRLRTPAVVGYGPTVTGSVPFAPSL
jgi:hypothetical protein